MQILALCDNISESMESLKNRAITIARTAQTLTALELREAAAKTKNSDARDLLLSEAILHEKRIFTLTTAYAAAEKAKAELGRKRV